MSLLDKLRKKYKIKVRCENCNKYCDCLIDRGTSVGEAIANASLICDFCGCSIEVEDYETEWSNK